MDNRAEVRDFLTSRRARLTPEEAGLPLYGTNRRVTGLRREEVALLAGVSTDYYTRLERGNLSGVSDSVLEGLAARAAPRRVRADATCSTWPAPANTGGRQRRTPPKQHVRVGVQRILDSIHAPAYVRNNRFDLLGVNRLGRALHARPGRTTTTSRPNLARYMFLDPRSRDFYVEWAAVAKDVVAALRIEAGRNPYDRGLDRPGRRALHPQRGVQRAGGPATTCGCTAPPPRRCTTPSWASSSSPARHSSCPATPG